MAGQVALALVLLVSSGLMVRSFQTAARDRSRLRRHRRAHVQLSAYRIATYPSRQAAVAAHHAILERLSALPGVTAASASTCLPLAGACYGNTMRVEGRTYAARNDSATRAFRAVAAGFFDAMGMRIVRGRGIIARRRRAQRARRRGRRLARKAVLSRIRTRSASAIASNRPPARPGELPTVDWLTIVGVVANTPVRTLVEPNSVSVRCTCRCQSRAVPTSLPRAWWDRTCRS